MSYYMAGGVVRTGRPYRVRFAGRRGYYMAGGWFKRLLHKAVHVVDKVAFHTMVGSFIGGELAGAVGLGGVYNAAGRVADVLNSVTSAPAGMPVEGTPPLGTIFRTATFKSGSHRARGRLYLAAARRRRRRYRR